VLMDWRILMAVLPGYVLKKFDRYIFGVNGFGLGH
jgi:hypothetical protein